MGRGWNRDRRQGHHPMADPTTTLILTDDLTAARAGDEQAFARLTRPLQREIHVHCYRMLGSLDDADDALQDALIRAWRNLAGFEPRAPFRAWLYRIATNVCLTMLERRGRMELSMTEVIPSLDVFRAGTPESVQRDLEGDLMRLDPYPDALLDEWSLPIPGPEATVERRESIELAFVAAVQLLPPRQRATLLLRDVIGYSAAEVAATLETSVAGVNSALQRARTTIEAARERGALSARHVSAGSTSEQSLVTRLIAAWHAVDVPSIVSLLTEDAVFSMPPEPIRVFGREAIATFLRTVPAGGQLDRFRMLPMTANGQPALATYVRRENDTVFHAYGITVLAMRGDEIASLTRFRGLDLVTRSGFPPHLDPDEPV